MNNRERAAEVIREHGKDTICNEPECLAQDLDDAGLLAPDLPEPMEHGGKPVWPLPDPDEWAVSLHDGWIQLSDERGVIFTASTKLARDLGHIFLAAANHAEGKQ